MLLSNFDFRRLLTVSPRRRLATFAEIAEVQSIESKLLLSGFSFDALDFEQNGDDWKVSGTIADDNGDGFDGVSVELTGALTGGTSSIDEDGNFSFTVPRVVNGTPQGGIGVGVLKEGNDEVDHWDYDTGAGS